MTEALVLALGSTGSFAVLGALCKLVERREFKRITPTLMSLYYQAREVGIARLGLLA